MARQAEEALGRFYEGQDLDALVEMPRYYDWILEPFRPHLFGNVLEVGPGIGSIAAMYADSVERLLLLEPAQNLKARLEERFAGKPHVRVKSAFVEEIVNQVDAPSNPADLFDAVVLVNVLEHVQDDAGMLSILFNLIRPGGAILIFVPALQWLYGALDERVGHLRRYTSAGLDSLVARVGFSPELMRYFDLPGVIPWFVTGRLLRQARYNRRAATLYDRLVVPIARWFERAIPPPFGKNLVCVARRPALTPQFKLPMTPVP